MNSDDYDQPEASQNDFNDFAHLNQYNQKINYKTEHYCRALAQSIGKNIKPEDIENQALENLKNLDVLGGIKNEV